MSKEKECKHCENISEYNRGCCSLKLRGIKCSFEPTKIYYIKELSKTKKQLTQTQHELKIANKMIEIFAEAEQYNGFDPDYPVEKILERIKQQAIKEVEGE